METPETVSNKTLVQSPNATVLSSVYHPQSAPNMVVQNYQIRQRRPSTTKIQNPTGVLMTLDKELPTEISSNQSHMKNPLLKTSRFLRVMEGTACFIRDIYQPILRPLFIGIAVIVGITLLGPAILGFLV